MADFQKQIHCEDVLLPSRGIVYNKTLGIGDTISLKPFTNKDMKGLYANAGDSGLETLLDNSINQSHMNWTASDLIPQDRDMLLMRLRAITLGSRVGFDLTCGSCGASMRQEIDLDTLKINYFDEGMQYPLVLTLPDSGTQVLYRILSHKERKQIERLLDERAKKFPKFNKTAERVFYTFARKIAFTDGKKSDFQSMYDFYSDLSAIDATYLMFIENQFTIGPETKASCLCPSCGTEQTFEFNFSSEFFRPTFEKPSGLAISSSSSFGNNDETNDAV